MIGFATLEALADVRDERIRQEEIGRNRAAQGTRWTSCADPAMDGGDDRRLAVLAEEFGEVARALLERENVIAALLEDGSDRAAAEAFVERHLRDELVQVAAVAVAWVEAVDARTGAIPRCRVCGCTDDEACEGGCSWVAVDDPEGGDLCSRCADRIPA